MKASFLLVSDDSVHLRRFIMLSDQMQGPFELCLAKGLEIDEENNLSLRCYTRLVNIGTIFHSYGGEALGHWLELMIDANIRYPLWFPSPLMVPFIYLLLLAWEP